MSLEGLKEAIEGWFAFEDDGSKEDGEGEGLFSDRPSPHQKISTGWERKEEQVLT